jgi:SMP-30/Gluconolactonase/LRE-like region
MFNKLFIAIIGMSILFACKNGQPKQADAPAAVAADTPKVVTHKLVQKWETDTILKVPESVIFDAKNKVLYAANITGKDPWAADGKGSIGKIGLDGKIINVDWVTGLQAPKGMGIYNDKLYVADLQEIAVIDIASGKIERKIKVMGCKGLNDISIDPSGIIYVTDSEGKRLYKVESGNSTTMMLDSLAGPNGVLVSGKNLFLLNNGGLYKVNQGSKYSISLITDGMEGGTDGIEHIKDEDYLISCWAGAIWYLNGDGRKELLYDGKSIGKNTADIGFDPTTKTVYVPTFWKNSVMAFEVVEN